MQPQSFSYNNIDIPIEQNYILREYGYENFTTRQSNKFYHKKIYHTFQFVSEGSGIYLLNGKKYVVGKGDVFYLPPNIPLMYYSSKSAPYTYYWISFQAENDILLKNTPFSMLSPIASLVNFDSAINEFDMLINNPQTLFSIKSHVYAILNVLMDKNLSVSNTNDMILYDTNLTNNTATNKGLIKDIIKFMEINYPSIELQITDIQNLFRISPSSLYRLFKSETDLSPKQYLLSLRMNKSKELLKKGFSVSKTAESVGFFDVYHFSKQFKKMFGNSPTRYKRDHKSD